jgi:hypothetical protein
MTEALDKAGKPYHKIDLRKRGKCLTQLENRQQFYDRMLVFLAKYLK